MTPKLLYTYILRENLRDLTQYILREDSIFIPQFGQESRAVSFVPNEALHPLMTSIAPVRRRPRLSVGFVENYVRICSQ